MATVHTLVQEIREFLALLDGKLSSVQQKLLNTLNAPAQNNPATATLASLERMSGKESRDSGFYSKF